MTTHTFRRISRFVLPYLIAIAIATLTIFGSDIIFRTDLATFDRKVYEDCRQLLDHPLVINKNTAFYVNKNPIVLLRSGVVAWTHPFINGINFNPELLSEYRYFIKAVAAHELGHHELGHLGKGGTKQFEADLFALKILGYDKKDYFFSALEFRGISVEYREQLFDKYWEFLRTERRLEYISQSCYRVCKRLEAQPLVTKRGTEFLIGSDRWVVGSFVRQNQNADIENRVYVELNILGSEHFETSVAHELGHIQYNTPNHIVADEFAAKLTSREKVLAWLQEYTKRDDANQENIQKRILALTSKQ